MHGPDVIAFEPPERFLRSIRLPRRPELLEQGLQFRLRFSKRHVNQAALPACKGVQDEEGLMRGTLVSLPPDAQLVETPEDSIRIHGLLPCDKVETRSV